jgi:1-phosphofructokinase family hexose kinase
MEKGRYILTVTLNPVVDKTIRIPGFRAGLDFREENLSVSAGGKGINVSQVLKHLGVANRATGFLSRNGGTFIEEELSRATIPFDFTSIGGYVRTSLTVIDPGSPRLTRILERGPRVRAKDTAAFRKKYRALLENAHAVVLSGRSIPGAPDTLYADLIRDARKTGVFSVFDTSGAPYPAGLEKKPDMIKPNIEETEEALGIRVRSLSAIRRAAREFHRRGIRIVAITRGSRGAYVSNGRESYYVVPPKMKRINPVGCGDAFISGFLAAFAARKSLRDCARFAAACGAANTQSIDPGNVDRREAYRIHRQVEVR